MLLTSDVLRLLLFLGMFGMALMAAFYLHGRSLSLKGYLGWGALIVFLPVLDLLVILLRPGSSRKEAEMNGWNRNKTQV